MKFSENIEKTTLPGKKNLLRYFDESGSFYRDAIILGNEKPDEIETVFHPVYPEKNTSVKNSKFELLLQKVVAGGEIHLQPKPLTEIHNYLMERASLLPDEHKRFISPHIYKVGISRNLMFTRNELSKLLLKQK